jgi:hypothetical protein
MRSNGWTSRFLQLVVMTLVMCFAVSTASNAGPPPEPHALLVAGDHTQQCSCHGSVSTYSASGGTYMGWKVDSGACTNEGSPCSWYYYGTTTYSGSYTVPAGKCCPGIDFYVQDYGVPVPTCTRGFSGDQCSGTIQNFASIIGYPTGMLTNCP